METIKTSANKGTKRYEQLKAMAGYNIGFNLWDVYGSYSGEKARAWQWCFDKCNNMNGYGFHITSKNTFGFSVAWETETHIFIETPKNSYVIEK